MLWTVGERKGGGACDFGGIVSETTGAASDRTTAAGGETEGLLLCRMGQDPRGLSERGG